MQANIALLPGDGIGPEVVEQAQRVLEEIARRNHHTFLFSSHLIGGCSIDKFGTALTDETLSVCQMADAVLLGAVGGPKWDDPNAPVRPEQGLLKLRKGLGVFANLRPVKVHPSLADASPLKPALLKDVDMVVVRELTGGLYFGSPKGEEMVDGQMRAVDTMEYSENEVERIVRLAFLMAQSRRKKLTSVDKANVLATSRLWRRVTNRVAQEFPDVTLEHMLVDTASMKLIASPGSFDVLVTENTFGDILTDEASLLAGSMGLLPSASLGNSGPGLYEPIHGSAPDIAGKGIANPLGTLLSAALMLRYSLHLEKEALSLEKAVDRVITEGSFTRDLGGNLSTAQTAESILKFL
jgi:3-isopropylmalate dehydrogenase